MPTEKLYSITEAAHRLHMCPATLREKTRRGLIKAERLGLKGDRFYSESELARYEAARRKIEGKTTT